MVNPAQPATQPSKDQYSFWRVVWPARAPVFVTLLVSLYTVATIGSYSHKDWHKWVTYGGHLLVIIVMLLAFPTPNSEAEDNVGDSQLLGHQANRLKTAIRVERRLSRTIRKIWLGWLIFYVIMIIADIFDAVADKRSWAIAEPVLFNLSNNTTSLLALLSYFELTTRTYDVENARRIREPPLIEGIGLLVLLTLLDAIATIKFTSAASQATQPITGFVAAIVLAMFLARFDNQLIRAPRLLTMLAYAYVGIQAAYPLLFQSAGTDDAKKELTRLVIIVLAVWMKLALFLLFYWLFNSGVLLYYLVEARIISERTEFARSSFVAELHDRQIKP